MWYRGTDIVPGVALICMYFFHFGLYSSFKLLGNYFLGTTFGHLFKETFFKIRLFKNRKKCNSKIVFAIHTDLFKPINPLGSKKLHVSQWWPCVLRYAALD